MRTIILICVVILVFASPLYEAKDLVLGTRVNNLLISTEKFVYKSIPFIKRDKDYTYTDPKLRIIKGIIARDLSRSEGEVTVTAGGVGDTHVTLHLRSGRGEGLNYLILIFSNNSARADICTSDDLGLASGTEFSLKANEPVTILKYSAYVYLMKNAAKTLLS